MIDDGDLDEQLRSWGRERRDQAPGLDLPTLPAEVGHRRSLRPVLPAAVGHRRTLRPVLAGVGVVLAVAIGVVAANSLRPGDQHRRAAAGPRTPVTAPSRRAQDLVPHNGDTVRVSGDVLATPGRPVRLCPPYGGSLVGNQWDGFTQCPGAVDATGVDVSRLSDRREHSGAVRGEADLVGTYRNGRVQVTQQGPFTHLSDPPQSRYVPCAAPPGGWPRLRTVNIDMAAAQTYQHRHPGTIVTLANLRPAVYEVLAYVLTAGDPAPVRAGLAPTYGARLCVTRSHYTSAQISSAYALMQRHIAGRSSTSVISCGEGLSDIAQPDVFVDVPIVSSEFARLVDTQPAGLIQLTAWLTPEQ